jgi:RNA polymerase sigma-70 factor, ECF subfamily
MRGAGSPNEVLHFCEATVQDYMARSKYTLALEMLVQHYQDPILRYCHCHVLDPEVAREVAQEVFLAALEGMPRFRGHASLKTWLYSIALKKCLETGRNSARRDALAHDHQRLILQRAHRDPPAQPEETFSQATQRQLVWQALHRLRGQERELVVLRYLEDLTYDEMAHILKVSKRTIERRLPLAQAKFHQAYETCQRKVITNKKYADSSVKEGE